MPTFSKEAVFALARAAEVRVRELALQRSVLERQYPQNRASDHVHQSVAQYLDRVFTTAAIEQLDKLACNEYWFVTLAATALCTMDESKIEADQVVAGAMIHRQSVDADFVVRVNNTRWSELEEWELRKAKELGVVVTDDTWPFDDRDRINPIFCV